MVRPAEWRIETKWKRLREFVETRPFHTLVADKKCSSLQNCPMWERYPPNVPIFTYSEAPLPDCKVR